MGMIITKIQIQSLLNTVYSYFRSQTPSVPSLTSEEMKYVAARRLARFDLNNKLCNHRSFEKKEVPIKVKTNNLTAKTKHIVSYSNDDKKYATIARDWLS